MKKILLSTLICLSALVGCATPINNSSSEDVSTNTTVSTTLEFDPVSYTQAYLSNFIYFPGDGVTYFDYYFYIVPRDIIRFDFASIGDVSRLSFFKDKYLQDEIYSKVITLMKNYDTFYMCGADNNIYELHLQKEKVISYVR